MTLPELENQLRGARVPDWFYVTDGGLGTGECVGIEQTPNGWFVYYSERGRKSPLDRFPDEDSACRALLRHVNRMMVQAGLGAII